MAGSDALNMPDGRDLLRTMGWVPLPYSCIGLARKTGETSGNNIWSWIVLVPWSSNGKPWIDGTEVVPASLKTEEQERELMFDKMRAILDERYGETIANQAVDDLIAEIFDES